MIQLKSIISHLATDPIWRVAPLAGSSTQGTTKVGDVALKVYITHVGPSMCNQETSLTQPSTTDVEATKITWPN